MNLHIRCVQRPTKLGLSDVHADGRTVSNVLAIPWMILKPVMLAIIKPIVAAASATVEMCPIEITDAMIMLCSNMCVLHGGVMSSL